MKKILFSVSALFAVVMVWAFVMPQNTKNEVTHLQEDVWFRYIGNGSTFGNPEDYERVSAMPGCEGSEELCAISIQSDGGTPERPLQTALTPKVQDIQDAVQFGIPTSSILLED